MFIQKISLKNITVFDTLDMQFSDGINVFIGPNGVGKTHLLKILYDETSLNFYSSYPLVNRE